MQNEYLKKTDISSRFSDEESIQKQLSRWNGQGRYTAIIGLKYYPSQRVLSKLKLLEMQIDTEMKDNLSQCTNREDRENIKYD